MIAQLVERETVVGLACTVISRSAVRLRLAGGSTFLSICFHPACLPSRQSCSGSESPCSWCILKGPLNCLPVISFSSFHCLIIILFVYLFVCLFVCCEGRRVSGSRGREGEKEKEKEKKAWGGGGSVSICRKEVAID